jgi:hypothetical protein
MEKRTLVTLGWDLISTPQYTLLGKRRVMKISNLEESRGSYLQLGRFSRRVLRGKDPSPTGFDGLQCAGQDQRRDREVNKGAIYLETSLLKGDVLAGERCII